MGGEGIFRVCRFPEGVQVIKKFNRRRKCLFLLIGLFVSLSLSGCGLFVEKIPRDRIGEFAAGGQFITIDGVRHHYREYPAPGRNVVLVHGFSSSTYTWEKVAPMLQERGYHVWALDMKGFGWSDKPRNAAYDTLTLAAEVNRWMEAVNLRDAVIAGNSLGGGVAWLMALLHPDKVHSLILVDAAAYPIEMPPVMKMSAMPVSAALSKLFFSRAVVRWTLAEVYHRKDLVTDAQVDAYFDRLRTENALDAQIAVVRSLDYKTFEPYIRRIPEIKKRTLVIWGENDRWVPLHVGRRLKAELPDATLAVIPACGHIPQEERPEETAKLMAAFMAAGER
jgi:pimeloyl-ACP methyl ester carboxylesterase